MPEKDESIHSFIMRLYMVHSCLKKSNIISKDGRWSRAINVCDEILPKLYLYNDMDIVNSMMNIGWAVPDKSPFSDPTSIIGHVSRLIKVKGEKVNRKSHLEVKFCMACVIESIKSNGFGYFKGAWGFREVRFCKDHNCTLVTVESSSRNKTIDDILMVCSGRYPSGCFCELLDNSPLDKYCHEYIRTEYYNPSIVDDENYVYIADCLRQNIKSLLQTGRRSFPEPVFKYIGLKGNDSIYLYGSDPVFTRKEFAGLIDLMFKCKYDYFIDFWNENAYKHKIYFGVLNRNSISTEIYVYRNIDNCGECVVANCPVKEYMQ
ncbi:hypothetical protein [Vibrio alfacsensis]|uniref:hypothetical protein n=1 Tax=Vibrio alfacsensis TaxID=1074311 RepID=UPI004067C3FC